MRLKQTLICDECGSSMKPEEALLIWSEDRDPRLTGEDYIQRKKQLRPILMAVHNSDPCARKGDPDYPLSAEVSHVTTNDFKLACNAMLWRRQLIFEEIEPALQRLCEDYSRSEFCNVTYLDYQKAQENASRP